MIGNKVNHLKSMASIFLLIVLSLPLSVTDNVLSISQSLHKLISKEFLSQSIFARHKSSFLYGTVL